MRRALVAASVCGLMALGTGTAYAAPTDDPTKPATSTPTTHPGPDAPTATPSETDGQSPSPDKSTPAPSEPTSTEPEDRKDGEGEDETATGETGSNATGENSEDAENKPSFTLVGRVAYPGQTIGALVKNCVPNEKVKLSLRKRDGSAVTIGRAEVNEDGFFHGDLQLPKWPEPGNLYTVTANCGGKTLSDTLYVTEPPEDGEKSSDTFYVSDDTIHAGQKIHFWGSGCTYSDQAQVTVTATFPNGKGSSYDVYIAPGGGFAGYYKLTRYTFADRTYTISAECDGAELDPITLTVANKPGGGHDGNGDDDGNGGTKDEDDTRQAASTGQEDLPFTGTNTLMIAGIAAALLAAGGALTLVTRRRKQQRATQDA